MSKKKTAQFLTGKLVETRCRGRHTIACVSVVCLLILVVTGVLGGIFLALTFQPETTINVTAYSSTTASDKSGESDEAELYRVVALG